MERDDASPGSSGLGPVAEPTTRRNLAGALGTGAAVIVGQGVAGLTMLFLARRMTPSEFGTFAVLYTAGIVLAGLLDFGSSQLRTRELAKDSGSDSFTSWVRHRTAWQVPLVVVATGVCQAVVGNKTSLWVTAALISQGFTYPIAMAYSGAVRALRSPALGTWAVAGGNLLMLAAAVGSPDRSLAGTAALGATLSWLVTAACCWWLIRPRLGAARSSWLSNPWEGSSGFGLFSLALALGGVQVIVVGVVAGSAEAGELAAVARWVQPVYLIGASISTQAFPSMAAAATDASARGILRSMWGLAALGVGIAAGIVAEARRLVDLLLGPGYENSARLLQAMAVAALPVIVTQPLATFLQARGAERPVALATTFTVALSLATTAVAANWAGAIAAPICAGLANVLLIAILVRTRPWATSRSSSP